MMQIFTLTTPNSRKTHVKLGLGRHEMDWKDHTTTAQKCIDKQIAYHEECIRKLREERNILAPISKLPPEILGCVFSFVLEGETRTSINFPFPLYRFSHVSQSWRSVALHTPHLWRILIPVGSQWTTIMLKRSKAADLAVVSSPSPSGLQSFDHVPFMKQVLTEHASRIRELDLSHFFTLAALFGDLQHSTLRLHSLRLVSYTVGSYSCPTFPSDVMEVDNLQRLEVHDCDGPWYSMSLRALTILKLYEIKNRPPLIEFLELLRGLPNLQVLGMADSLPFARDHDRVDNLIDPVHLPRLQCLELMSRENQMEVANILSCIIVPPTATLSFYVHIEEDVTDVDALASSLSTFFSHMSRSHAIPSYTSLNIELGELLQAWIDFPSFRRSVPNLEVGLLRNGFSLIGCPTVVHKIVSSLPLFDITTLRLYTKTVLGYTFGHLPRLRDVIINGGFTSEIIEIIEALTRESHSHPVPFPALESLSIENGEFGSDMVERFQDCLMERYEQKAELSKLELVNGWELYRSDVEKFREIVVNVEWDEREQSSLAPIPDP